MRAAFWTFDRTYKPAPHAQRSNHCGFYLIGYHLPHETTRDQTLCDWMDGLRLLAELLYAAMYIAYWIPEHDGWVVELRKIWRYGFVRNWNRVLDLDQGWNLRLVLPREVAGMEKTVV